MTVDHAFLRSLGWNESIDAEFVGGTDSFLGRISGQGRGHYQVIVSVDESLDAAITSKFHDAVQDSTGFPAIGDWVELRREGSGSQAAIHRVINRKNSIQRRRSGAQSVVQMIAANVDFLFIVSSMNEDFDLQRLGRYIELGREPSCETILLLTKSDLSANPVAFIDEFRARYDGVKALAISSEDPASMDVLETYFSPGKTGLLVGSSGVGKSTLTNYLLGFHGQRTGAVTSEARGRHTTTARSLRFTRWGGMVIDTPGMQEISGAVPGEAAQEGFTDIDELALRCKFTDCKHKSEPGCEVLIALKNGSLRAERWHQYLGVTTPSDPRRKKNKYSD